MSGTPSEPVRILAVAGSLRESSFNRRLLEAARALASDGVEFEYFTGLASVEPFDEDHEFPEPAGVGEWRSALARADAVLVATPEYNASIPGQLKNAFDWASRPPQPGQPGGATVGSAMYGKPVSVVSTSTGQFGGVWAAQELRKSLKTQGARVVEQTELAVGSAATAFNEDGSLVSPDQARRLAELVSELTAMAAKIKAVVATSAS